MPINITNGSVSVEDGTKASEDYTPARKVRVELHFDNPTADDINTAGDLASAQVDRLLGRTTAATAAEATKRTRRTKEQIAADEAAKNSAPSADPLDGLEPTKPAEAAPPPAEEVDELAGLLGGAGVPPAEEITDVALTEAVTKTNAATRNPPAIRALVDSYNPDPTKTFQLRQIPQEKRAEFLKKLGEIQPKQG